MKRIFLIIIVTLLSSYKMSAQNQTITSVDTAKMIFRISEIEVYPQFLDEYLVCAHDVGAISVKVEPGVICIFPMQVKRDKNQVRIIEIYASQEAYKAHIASAHFQKYKTGTMQMVKSLRLEDCDAMAPETLELIFKKAMEHKSIFPAEIHASNEYSTGDVYISLLKNSSQTMVTHFLFTTGSRNFWHYHPDAEQTLLVLEGEGYYQEEGGEKHIIRKGDVFVTKPNIRHWNGATADSYIYCMTITELSKAEHAIQLRAVTNEEYSAE